MLGCNLHISGENLDVDALVAKCGLKPYRIAYKGEPIFKTRPDSKLRTWSAVSFEASSGGNFKHQLEECTAFLEKYRAQLAVATVFENVQFASLNFGIIHSQSAFVQENYFPAAFIKLCSELSLGIEVSVYQDSEEN